MADDELNIADLAALLEVAEDAELEDVRARIRTLFADAQCQACQSYRVAVVSQAGHRGIVVQCRRCSHLSVMLAGDTAATLERARNVERRLLFARYKRTGRMPSWSDWVAPPDRSKWPPVLRTVTG